MRSNAMLRRFGRRVACAVGACTVAGCAHYPLNAPLEATAPGQVVGEERPTAARRSDVALILAFSGGGTRAAALAYGVLETLRDTPIPGADGERRLLDEVDLISAVSGGGFTAAYYGLYGDRMFTDYEDRFLKRDVEEDLFFAVWFPGNWFRLASRLYERSDLAAEVYDRLLFHGATLGDLQEQSPCRVDIQATDIARTTRFEFTPSQFQLLCSDYGSYPVARAVAASAAVPVVFSPITLKDYGDECGGNDSALRSRQSRFGDVDLRTRNARRIAAYRDGPGEYVHLIDGGIVDNLGVHALLDEVIQQGGWEQALAHWNVPAQSRIAVIVVNAQIQPVPGLAEQEQPPGVSATLDAVTSLQVNRYNLETMHRLRRSLTRWVEGDGGVEPDAVRRAYVIEVGFGALTDEALREAVSSLPTRFSLSDDAVENVQTAANEVLTSDPEFQALLWELGARREADPQPADEQPSRQ